MAGTKLIDDVKLIKDVSKNVSDIDDRVDILEKYGIYRTLAELKKAKASSDLPYTLLTSDGRVEYTFVEGDFTGAVDDRYIISPENVAPNLGAFVIQSGKSLSFKAPFSGAVSMSVSDALSTRFTIEMFGAKGNGVTDDTVAFERALSQLPEGATLNLRENRNYLVKRSLVIRRPIKILGGAKEQCSIVFAADGNYLSVGDGGKAAVIALHPSVPNILDYNNQAIVGNAVRSVFSGITFKMQENGPANVNGICIAAPIYVYECDVKSFTADGFLVKSGIDQLTKGNANGCTFTNCISQFNSGSGFTFVGNDANACLLSGCRAPSNGAWGFFDNSLLGNCYIQCEADNNRVGGYFATNLKPCKSTYVSCYSETPTHFQLGNRCVLIAPQGLGNSNRSVGASAISGLPSGDTYSNKSMVFAESENIANVMAGPTEPGKVLRIGDEGIELKGDVDSPMLRLLGSFSANSYSLFVGTASVMAFAKRFVTGNFRLSTPWMPGGFVVGESAKSGIVGAGLTPPSSGDFDVGAIWLNDKPAADGYIGWVCVAAGSPGQWKAWGKIEL